MNKVLIITYYWPPSGGAGVQRWLKFAKYLPEFGWEPIILTVDPEFAAYPVTDYSLEKDLPATVEVYKTPATDYFSIYNRDRSKIPSAGFANSVNNTLKGKFLRFIRGNFFLPDPRKGWNKFAFKKACEIIQTKGIKHVITTSPPHSTQLIGLKIKKRYPGIKWIADLRDPWTDIYYYDQFYPTFISRAIDSSFEKNVLEKSDQIITVGNSLKDSFDSKVKGVAAKTVVITNGYDEDDFNMIKSTKPSKFTITYIGTLSDHYPVDGLVDALRKLQQEGREFNIRFVGTIASKAKELILSSIEYSSVEFIPYTAHKEAIKYMLNSSVLLLIIPFYQNNKSIITGKLFEYLATGTPVICLGPGAGDAAGLLKESGHGKTFHYSDSKGIFNNLTALFTDNSVFEKASIKDFTRRELAKKVVSVLEK
ncbi:MAG TPA: glycosyltransferase [Bacteroidales bacterium]|nr:glycosyltransferase [Bacteroidales bacterium]